MPRHGRHRAAQPSRHSPVLAVTAVAATALLASSALAPHQSSRAAVANPQTSLAASADHTGPASATVSTARSHQWTVSSAMTSAAESSGPLARTHGASGVGLPPTPHAVAARREVATASRGVARTYLPSFVRPGTGRLTSCFCMRWGVLHEGIDLAAPLGSPIYAAGAGVVTRTGPSEGFGFLIVVRLPDGTENWYGHEEATLVQVGEHVRTGQLIARVGSEGESTGPHLHFQVMVHDKAIDPIPWLRTRGVRV